jgi:hypothetical protein
MGINEAIDKEKRLASLNSRISILNSQIRDVETDFRKKKMLLSEKKDAEIKELFKRKLAHPELQIEERGDEIKGQYGGLIYCLKINDKERIISEEQGSTKKVYKFKYTVSAFLPSLSCHTTGAKSDEEAKNMEISALESHLERCNKAVEKLDSDGIKIEYAQTKDNRSSLHGSIFINRKDNVEEHYCNIDIQGLIQLIGI